MLKRLTFLLPLMTTALLVGCQTDGTKGDVSSGYYSRQSICQNILQQLGTTEDHINDPGMDDTPERDQLITNYRANGCDK